MPDTPNQRAARPGESHEDHINRIAVDALYQAREEGKVMDDAARAVAATVEPHIRADERSRVLEALAGELDEMASECSGFPAEVTKAMTIRDCADHCRTLAAKEES